MQQQIGSLDCGLFAIAFATELCKTLGSLDLDKVIFEQSMMRQHLEHCIRENRKEVFPKHILPLNDLPVPDIFHIELFCYCKMPDIFDEFNAAVVNIGFILVVLVFVLVNQLTIGFVMNACKIKKSLAIPKCQIF